MSSILVLIDSARRDYETARRELLLHHTPSTKYPSSTPEQWRKDHALLRQRVYAAAQQLDRLESEL